MMDPCHQHSSSLPAGRGSDQKPTPGDPDTFRFVALDPGRAAADNVRHRAASGFAKRNGGVSRANTQTPYTLDFDALDATRRSPTVEPPPQREALALSQGEECPLSAALACP